MSQTSKFTTANSGPNQIQSLERELEYLKQRLQAYESASYYRTSQDVFSAAFYQSSQCAAMLALDGTVIAVNHALLNLANVAAEDVVGRRFWQVNEWVASSTDVDGLQKAIIRAGQGEPTQHEIRIRQIQPIWKTGDRFISLNLTIQPICNDMGHMISVLVEGRIHAKRHTLLEQRIIDRTTSFEATSNDESAPLEATQRNGLNHFAEQDGFKRERCDAALAQISPVGIFRADTQGRCIYVNDRLCQLSGLSPQDALGMTWIQAVYPADREMVSDEWRRSVQDNQPFRVEFRYQRSNGSIIWVVGQMIAETTDAGDVTGYVGSVIDITDRKQAELTIQESEERFRATFEQAAVGLSHVGLDGRWLRVNQKLCEIVGYSREELLQLTFQSITHPEDLDANVAMVHQLLTGDVKTYCMEKRYLRKDGTPTWVNITVSLMRESMFGRDGGVCNGKPNCMPEYVPKYMIVVIEDINDRKQAAIAVQERAEELSQLNTILSRTTTLLEERNRELDQFAYIASHDLKAPLRAIANLSEWIEEDLDGALPEENQQQLQLLRSRVHRMEALIHGLLEYSRAGRTQTTVDTISMNALLAEVIDSLAPPASFKINIPPDMPTLNTRSLLLRQVFANLIGNAVKHHDRPDGQVTISVCDRGRFHEFAVSDDGPGIAPENHNKVFIIFQTLTARDVKESTGIGLSIVKKIVETEGGKITLESEIGKGATFRFTWLKQPKQVANSSR